MALVFLLALAFQVEALTLHFFASPSTPFDLGSLASKVVSDLSSPVKYIVEHLTIQRTEEPIEEGVVLDYTYDEEFSALLRQQNPDVLVMWSQGSDFIGVGKYGEMFSRYLQALQFTRVTLISDSKQSNIQLSQFLVQTFPEVYEDVHIIPFDAGEKFCLQFVGQVLKPSGANLFAIVTDGVAAMNLLKAFDTKKLGKEGYAYVLSKQASYYQHLSTNNSKGLLSTGTLYITDELSALARSLVEAEELSLKPILQQLVSGQTDVSRNHSIVLVNVVNSVPRIVATSPADVELNGQTISFPGNSSIVPFRTTAVIQTSVNYDIIDYTGDVLPVSRTMMRGIEVAFEEVNNSSEIIPNFSVDDYPVAFSGQAFNYTFAKSQILADLLHLGVIHFPLPTASDILGALSIFKELNITIPISADCSDTVLSSPAAFPLYLRARTSNAYNALVMARMFSYFEWKRAAILYSLDEGDNQDFYTNFMNLTSTFGITITNEESMRGLEPYLAGPTAELNASISDIMNSTVRIIIMLHNYGNMIMDTMFDLGIRSEYLICIYYGMTTSILSAPENFKIRVVAKGALQFYPTPFIGEQGAKVLSYLEAWDGSNYYSDTCYSYDCAMLYLYSTGYMISRGIDYEDPYQIAEAMRGTRFAGCAGTIYIVPNSNDRSAAQFSVSNAKYYEGNDTVVVEDVMYYNPFSSTLYQQIKPIMWPDNSTTVFTDTLIPSFKCPFLEKLVRDFFPGRILGYGICFGICLLTGLCCLLIWRRWWNVSYPMLLSKSEISADDYMQLAALPFEFLQLAAVGPKSEYLGQIVIALCESVVLNLDQFLDYSGEMYWTILDAVLGCVGLYVCLCLLKFTGIEEKLESLPLVSFLLLWVDLCLPTFSNLLFMPTVSILSSIFLCYQSIGDNFTSSYLNYKCYQFCWQGSHITYVLLCSLALFIYIPLGVFTKPLWQEMQLNLHIKAQPPCLMVKSFLQVLLLTLSHTLRNDYPVVHAGLYFTVIMCDIALLVLFRQSNYGRYSIFRLNMWQILSMIGVLFYGITAFICQQNSSLNFPCLIWFIVTCVILTVTGLILQWKVVSFESKLYRRKFDATNLINFAFTFGSRASRHLALHRAMTTQPRPETSNEILISIETTPQRVPL